MISFVSLLNPFLCIYPVPQYSEATDDEMNLVEEERETLLDLGFDVELGGPTKIKLVGAPVDLVESKAFEILKYVFSYLHEYQQPTRLNYVMKC